MKKLFLILIGLGVLAAIAFALLVFNLNPIIEKFKPQLTEQISNAVQQPVELGEINVQFLPSVGLAVNDITIGSGEEQTSVNQLILKASIGDMMGGKLAVSKFEIDGGSVKIQRGSDGNIKVGGIALGEKGKDQTGESEKAGAGETKVSFSVDEAEVKNLKVHFQDESISPAQNFQISDFGVKVTDLSLEGANKKGNISSSFSFLGKKSNNFIIDGAIDGFDGGLPQGDMKLGISSLDLGRLGKILRAYKIDTQNLSLDQELALNGEVSMKGGSPVLNFNLEGSSAAISLKDLFEKPAGQTLSVSAQAKLENLSNMSTRLDNVKINLGSMKLLASGNVVPGGAAKLKVKSDSLPLSELGKFIKPAAGYALKGSSSFDLAIDKGKALKISGPMKLSGVSLNAPVGEGSIPVSGIGGDLEFKGENLDISGMAVNVAEQKLVVDAKISNFLKPDSSFDIKSERIEPAKLLAAIGKPNESLDGSYLQNLKLAGNYSLSGNGKVRVTASESNLAQVPVESVDVSATLAKNSIRITNSKVTPFGGELGFSGLVNNSPGGVSDFQVNGNTFDAAIISKTFMPDSKISLSGTIESVKTALSTKLANPVKTAGGTATAKVGKGAIEGINIIGQTLGGVKGLPGLGVPLNQFVPDERKEVLQATNTAFDSLTFESSLKFGKLNISSFDLNHDLYRLDGDGWIGIADGSKSIQARVRLTAKLAESMIAKEPKLQLIQDRDGGIVVPVLIKASPGGRTLVLPDLKDLIQRAGRNTAKEALGRELDKVVPGLGEVGGGLVDGLLGGGRRKPSSNSEGQEGASGSGSGTKDLGDALGGAAGKALEGLFN